MVKIGPLEFGVDIGQIAAQGAEQAFSGIVCWIAEHPEVFVVPIALVGFTAGAIAAGYEQGPIIAQEVIEELL